MTDTAAIVTLIVLRMVATLTAGYAHGLLSMTDSDIQDEQDKHAPEQARMRKIKQKMSRRGR